MKRIQHERRTEFIRVNPLAGEPKHVLRKLRHAAHARP
jgi:hypothetical protein